MTTSSAPPERSPIAWPALCAVLAIASCAVWWSGRSAALAWSSTDWQTRPWTLWSASLAHLSVLHLSGNLLALAVLALLGVFLRAGRSATWAVLLAWPLGTLGLIFWPQVSGYSGLSGLLCAMLGVLWFHTASDPGARMATWVLALALGFKLLSEHAWSRPIGYDPQWGFNVVYAAHLAGAACGVVCALTLRLAGSQRPKA